MNPLPNYWGGSTALSSSIRPLTATTFKELADSYFSVPVLMPMTRTEFLSRTDAEKNRLKDGPFILACTFAEGETVRNDNNAVSIRLNILDFDDSHYARQFAEAPEVIGELLWPYSYLVYTTAKHTPENPRLKIVVPVKECDKSHHKAIVEHLACDRLGLPRDFKGIRESKVISQPQYRPLQFQGEEHISVLACYTGGHEFDIKDLPAPVEGEEAPFQFGYSGSVEALDLLHLPLSDITVEDMREPVMAIDPDVGMDLWIHVGMGLRHQFRDEESAHAAFDLFEEWSAGGTKHVQGEPRNRWRTFRPDTTGKAPKTARSIFYLAMQHGWSNKKLAGSFQERVSKWINDCEDTNTLMDEGCRRIQEMPFANAMVEDLLIKVLQARIKTLTGHVIEKKMIVEQLKRTKRQVKEEQKSADAQKPPWLQPFVFIGPANVFRHANRDLQYTPDAFNNTFSKELLPIDPTADGTKATVSPTVFALNMAKIQIVEGLAYDPRFNGGDPCFKYEGMTYLNTYRSDQLPPEDKVNAKAAGELFVRHFSHLIREKEYVDLVIDHLCHTVQFPGVKIPWSAFISSNQGAGKNLLGDILKAVMGKRNVCTVSSDLVQQQWTDWMVDHQFFILNEIHTPGENREVVYNRLKPFFTDDYLSITKRNTTAFTWPSYGNSIAFSNHFDAFKLDEGDRRLMVIESPLQTKEQIEALTNSGHFAEVEILKDKWAGALRTWMLSRKISKDFPVKGPAPKTIYRDAVIRESKNRTHMELEELIADGTDPAIMSDIIVEERAEARVQAISRNSHKVAHYLHIMGYRRHGRFSVNGQRQTVWVHLTRYDDNFGTVEEIVDFRLGSDPDLT